MTSEWTIDSTRRGNAPHGPGTGPKGLDPASHPRPQLRRSYTLLDGEWQFALGQAGMASSEPLDQVDFDRTIRVPFAPETPASGLATNEPVGRCWYKTVVTVPPAAAGQRHVLHFGAVDREASIYLDGQLVATHVGGYTPFEVDITAHARAGVVELVVRAEDDPRDLEVPRGKQEWLEHPHAVWYPRTTGIWRSVFLETRGDTHVAALHTQGDPSAMTLDLQLRIAGLATEAMRARVTISSESTGRVFVDDTMLITGPNVERTFGIGDGGIDDHATLPWWPRRPHLFTVVVELIDTDGRVHDRIEGTAALRTFTIEQHQFCINGRPYPLRLVLDQGYWPDSGATPPSVEALRTDLELARSLGFNGVRKHQKIEDPRFFALADRMGMVAWVEMPSAYRAGPVASTHLLNEWTDVVEAHRSFTSVAAWVPINESWGVADVAQNPQQRSLIKAMAHLTDALDGTRPISANDGWETVGGSIVGIHDYDQDPATMSARYGTLEAIDSLVADGIRSDGRLVDLDRAPIGQRAVMLTEFGGTAMTADTTATERLGTDGGAWGYDEVRTADEFLDRYRELWAVVHESTALVGGCWTQLTDTYQEVNGLLTFDRKPKAPLERLAAATRGHRSPGG